MEKLVSVIVPVFNVEKYLSICVDSIRQQTYSSLEIILVDDGSKDKSGRICDDYKNMDSRITVIHQTNQGLSGARNSGIDIAKGDFILFVDSDDFLSLDMISHLVDLSEQNKADIVSCDNIRCDENATEMGMPTARTESIHIFEGEDKMLSFLKDPYIKVVAWGKLYNKTIFDEIRYPIGKYHEDNYTTYKTVHIANKIVTTNFVGCAYRNNSKSITNEHFSIKRLDDIWGKKEQLEFISEMYPNLQRYAEASIIYACNVALAQMGKSKFRDRAIEEQIKYFYRKYEFSYLTSSAGVKGKLFSIMAYFSYNLAFLIAKIM